MLDVNKTMTAAQQKDVTVAPEDVYPYVLGRPVLKGHTVKQPIIVRSAHVRHLSKEMVMFTVQNVR